MNDHQGIGFEEQGLKFVPASGSVISGMGKEKLARITDAMADLQLAINGLKGQLPSDIDEVPVEGNSNQWTESMGAFARACSIFLRKTVLGYRDTRETRLLDDRVLESIDLRFDRLRKIPRARRREIEVGFDMIGASLQLTKLNDHTKEPEAVYYSLAGPQGLKISIE